MDFSNSPFFRFSSHVLARPGGDGRWDAVDEEGLGSRIDESDFAGALELAAAEDGTGLYAIVDPSSPARKFRADYASGKVHVEDGGRTMDVGEFAKHAVRTGSDGTPICSMRQPLHVQYEKCREAGDMAHCLDVADMADAMRKSAHVPDQVGAGMYDIVSSGIDDGLSFMELMARVTARGDRAVHEGTALGTAFPGGRWAQIRDFPQYMMAPVRALFGSYMEEIAGEYPLEKVSRLHAPPGAPVAAMLDAVAEFVEEDPPFEGGNIVPGYRTSPVARYRGEGFECIVFTDMAGTYVYAWPSPEAPQPAPGR